MTTTPVLPVQAAATARRRHPRLRRLAIIGSATVLIGGGAAFAYWTSTGSGSGSAASSAPGTVTVAQTSTNATVNPGSGQSTLAGTITNPSGASSSVFIANLTVAFGTITKAAGAPAGTCDATDYALPVSSIAINQDIAAGASVNWTGLKLAFNNKSSNQDACKGATVNLVYTATAS